ncbi:MAG: hypothetical protein R2848_16670 [Thermomicrobiales bacterium]
MRAIAPQNARIIANGAALLKSDLLLQIVTDTLDAPIVALDESLKGLPREGAAVLALAAIDQAATPFDPVAGAESPARSSACRSLRRERGRQSSFSSSFSNLTHRGTPRHEC